VFSKRERLKTMEQNPEKRVNARSPDTLRTLDALEKFTLPVIEHFTNALNNEDKWVRYLAAEALGDLGDPRAIAPLNLLRDDKDPDLRFFSARSLSKIVYLRELLNDTGKRGCETCLMRYIAEEALVQKNLYTSPRVPKFPQEKWQQ
jgi:HEAT repeat protein